MHGVWHVAHPKTPRGDLVPISHARLRTWLDRRGLSANEVARRAGMLPQRLSLLVTGKVARCRRRDRQELARVLGVSVAFLSGDPAAEPPGGGLTSQMVEPVLTGERPRRRRPGARRAPSPANETRVQAEHLALLADLERTFPTQPDVAERVGPVPAELRADGVTEPMWRAMRLSEARAFGSLYALELNILQGFLGGSPDLPDRPDDVMERFAVDMARVIRTVLEPWSSGRLPAPPGGARLVSALGALTTELIQATLMGEIEPPEIIDAATAELEQMARGLRERQREARIRRAEAGA